MAREGRDLGLFNVHQPQSPTADLVFIHGLDGHRRGTWTTKSEEFWLPWLENDLRDVRIWTYGYDAGSILGSLDHFDLHVNQFLQDLSRCRSEDEKPKPIVFVAHSMGGILVKKAMILASPTESGWNSIFQNTIGIVFLGTPHRGSSSARGLGFRVLSYLRQILCCLSPPPFLSLLRADSPSLALTADQFKDVWGSRRIFSFYETEATFRGKMIVPRDDAIANCPGEQIYDVPDCNHAEICKPDSPQSVLFTRILEAIQSLLPQDSQAAAQQEQEQRQLVE